MSELAGERIATGIPGLDEALLGGLIPERAYLIRGRPGTGKTVFGLHFLVEGARDGEPVLFVTLSEPEERVRMTAASLGLDLAGVTFLDLTTPATFFSQGENYDIFSPAEVERGPVSQEIVAKVHELAPRRIFIDAITHLRYLTASEQEFRRHLFSLLRFLTEARATAMITSEFSEQSPDDDLQFMADGVIELASEQQRTLTVRKFRSSDYQTGPHGLRLDATGVHVYPRLIPRLHAREFVPEVIASDVPGLDQTLRGGLERGTITLITGPVGIGKTTLSLHFTKEAATRGEHSVVYLFEESVETLVHRSEALGIPIRAMQRAGTLDLVPIEPLRYTADEFSYRVRQDIEARGARVVSLDSVAGYRLALRGEDLNAHLHALTRYLRNMGVTAILVNESETIAGPFRVTETGFSYVADNVMFLRYVEIEGRIRKAFGVLKKRASPFDNVLREFTIDDNGIHVDGILTDIHGVLTGAFEFRRWPEGTPPREGQ